MRYRVEAWTVPMPDDEESGELELVHSCEFKSMVRAMIYARLRMQEGYFTRLWIM